MIARKNPKYRKSIGMGPKVHLDFALRRVLALYSRIVRESPEGGFAIPPDTDPIVERHLLAIHRVVAEERAKNVPQQSSARS